MLIERCGRDYEVEAPEKKIERRMMDESCVDFVHITRWLAEGSGWY